VRTRADILTELAVVRVQGGHMSAFETLVKLWHPRLLIYARQKTGSSEAARDVMQNVWIAVTRGLGRLNDPANYRGWIYRIVRNKCADWIRTEQARRKLAERANAQFDQDKNDAGQDEDVIGQIRSTIRTLPEDQRSVLTLFYLDDYSVQEISGILGIPEGTVKSRLFNARKMLKKALED